MAFGGGMVVLISNNRGMHWLLWDKPSVHKRHGGMGFKDLAGFNDLTMHAWETRMEASNWTGYSSC